MAAMSSTATLRPPNPRRSTDPPVAATINDGDLPLDLLYEILLRLPTEPLCRFRAVCRSWRSLLSHAEFIAAARHPGPLLAIAVEDYSSSNEVHVLDMESGNAVENVNLGAAKDVFHLSPPLYGAMGDDRVACALDLQDRLRLIDLASGAVSLLPDDALFLGSYTCVTSVIVGHAASTGEHKVLAIATSVNYHDQRQVCKILTLGDGSSGWRDTGSPPLWVWLSTRRTAVVNGVAYILLPYIKQSKYTYAHNITGFDFNTEAWRPAVSSLQGPGNCHDICLAKLNGHLVAGHADDHTSLELWFLVDLGLSLWSKRYTIIMPCYQNNHSPSPTCHEYLEKPLAVLDDGRIVLWMRGPGAQDAVLRIYNPRTKTFRDGTRLTMCSQFCVFTWNLLLPGQRGELDMAAKRLLLGRRRR